MTKKLIQKPEDLFGRLTEWGGKVAIDDRDRDWTLEYDGEFLDMIGQQPDRDHRFWTAIAALRQRGGTCVGHTGTHFIANAPLMTRDYPDPYDLYREAQLVDEWEGENYEGTSIRALLRVFRRQKRVLNYFWAGRIGEVPTDPHRAAFVVRDWIRVYGPVMLGTFWTADMMEPDPKTGFIRVTGGDVGGHAYLALGYSKRLDAIRIQNSWGGNWGQKGRAWISMADLAVLMADRWSEAALAVETRLVPRTVLAAIATRPEDGVKVVDRSMATSIVADIARHGARS